MVCRYKQTPYRPCAIFCFETFDLVTRHQSHCFGHCRPVFICHVSIRKSGESNRRVVLFISIPFQTYSTTVTMAPSSQSTTNKGKGKQPDKTSSTVSTPHAAKSGSHGTADKHSMLPSSNWLALQKVKRGVCIDRSVSLSQH
jgi:hypothetical protein